jgi:hypothetical protein
MKRLRGQQDDESRFADSLDDLPVAWIDRLLPRHPKAFMMVVVGVACGVWLLAFGVASNRSAFLMSREWQIQPLFLAGHLVTLRLFVTCYSRNYLRGAQYLDMSTASATKLALNVLGPWGGLAALALAAPFCFLDIASLKEYCLVPDAGVGFVDVIQAGVWCVEWAINAYIWVILVGFALLLTWTIRNQMFRDPLQTVIQLKQYRPFLLMSVQGSTTLVFFGALYGLYVWYADGDISDFIGLGVTMVLLLVCFVPPWLLLRQRLEKELKRQQEVLSRQLLHVQEESHSSASDASADLRQRLDEAIAMLRITQLDRLQQELGRAEGRAVVMRLLIPLSTVLMKVLRPLLLGL